MANEFSDIGLAPRDEAIASAVFGDKPRPQTVPAVFRVEIERPLLPEVGWRVTILGVHNGQEMRTTAQAKELSVAKAKAAVLLAEKAGTAQAIWEAAND
jgi:hypothetical protein